jgi:hypothetical protein
MIVARASHGPGDGEAASQPGGESRRVGPVDHPVRALSGDRGRGPLVEFSIIEGDE